MKRIHLTLAAAGTALTLALAACETSGPLVAPPDEVQFSRSGGAAVFDEVSQAHKEQGLSGGGAGGAQPTVSPLNYGVSSIPYQEGPRNLPNTMTLCDDCVLNGVPIGFDFTFYGNTYSALQISSNGFVRFNPPNNDSGCCNGQVIPLNDLWNNIIAWGWTDLIPIGGQSGVIRFGTVGAAPNRRFILHADSVRNFGASVGTRNLSAWMVLHEGSNIIELHTEFWTPATQNMTQGIENVTGTEAHFVSGRVATHFSLTNDGVRFTPHEISPVPIHRIYSGDPARGGDTISRGDEHVYVEILDVLTLMSVSTFRTANDVRIGATFETGVPGNAFQLVHIGGSPAHPDFRGRWSRQALQDAGLLPVGETTLVVWGRDPNTGRTYRGERDVTVIPGPEPQIDQNQPSATVFMAAFAQTDLAQSFQTQQGLQPTVGAGIFLQPGVGGTDNVHISLWDALPNAGGTMLAQGQAQGTQGQWVDVFFDTGVLLTPNTTYYLVFAGNVTLGIAGDITNPYPHGMVFANPGFTPFPNFDYTFRTWIAPAGGTFSPARLQDLRTMFPSGFAQPASRGAATAP